MNEREKFLLKSRQHILKKIIKDNEKLPKAQRDVAAMRDAKERLTTIKKWLNDKPLPPEVKAAAAVQEPPKKVRTPEGVVKIDTIEQLQEVFHDIKKKNIAISGPPEIQEACRKMMKDFVKEEFGQHYVQDNGANVHFWGIDPHGDAWNSLYKVKSTKRGKVEKLILERIGQENFDQWKSHNIRIYKGQTISVK